MSVENLEICLDKKRNINVTLFQDFVRIWSTSIYENNIRSYSMTRNGMYTLINQLKKVKKMIEKKRKKSKGKTRIYPDLYNNINLKLDPHFEKREDEICCSEIYLRDYLKLIFIVTNTKKEQMCINFNEKDISKFIKTFHFIDSIWDTYEKNMDFNIDLLFMNDIFQ